VVHNVCVDCLGDGKCSECNGTGVNTHVNEDELKCRKCTGTGVCLTCDGSDKGYVLEPKMQDLGLDKL
jgi:hypothetical protein